MPDSFYICISNYTPETALADLETSVLSNEYLYDEYTGNDAAFYTAPPPNFELLIRFAAAAFADENSLPVPLYSEFLEWRWLHHNNGDCILEACCPDSHMPITPTVPLDIALRSSMEAMQARKAAVATSVNLNEVKNPQEPPNASASLHLKPPHLAMRIYRAGVWWFSALVIVVLCIVPPWVYETGRHKKFMGYAFFLNPPCLDDLYANSIDFTSLAFSCVVIAGIAWLLGASRDGQPRKSGK